jgi:hypothetical protein
MQVFLCSAPELDIIEPDMEKEPLSAVTQRGPRRLRFKVAADENRSSVGKLIYLSLTTLPSYLTCAT